MADYINTVRFPAHDGEVQSQIDAADAEGGGRVVLHPEVNYDLNDPVVVPPNVELDCAGAAIRPTGDFDVFHVYPDARIIRPRVDLAWFNGSEYTSDVFRFDASYGGYFAGDCGVRGGVTLADSCDATVFHLVVDDGETNSIGLVENDHDIKRSPGTSGTTVDTAVHLENNDGVQFINGNSFTGMHYAADNGIRQTGVSGAKINGNEFHQVVHPTGNSSGGGWVVEAGSENLADGKFWDGQKWDRGMWVIESTAGSRNALVTNDSGLDEHVVDNSGDPTNRVSSHHEVGTTAGTVNPAYGREASASGMSSAAYGESARANYARTLSLGFRASCEAKNAGAIGPGAIANGPKAWAIGRNSTAAERSSVFGDNSFAHGEKSAVVGQSSEASGAGSVAIGWNAFSGGSGSISFGIGTSVDADDVGRIGVDQLAFGAVADTLPDANLRNGELTIDADESAGEFVVRYRDTNGVVQTVNLPW